MKFNVVIPARYASTRLPGKPLVEFAGKPMIQHVYEAACRSSAQTVVVATDDSRVAAAVKNFGGEVCETRADHQSGTDRLQEVVQHYGWTEDQILVNVQGDEPLIPPAVIDQVANNLSTFSAASAATLCWPIADKDELFDSNAVKVVFDDHHSALYFSRAPIPWHRESFDSDTPNIKAAKAMRHIGIYAYRAGLLNRFVTWSEGALERIEKLEQLRILANGERIHVAQAAQRVPAGVDTPEDAERVRQFLESALNQ